MHPELNYCLWDVSLDKVPNGILKCLYLNDPTMKGQKLITDLNDYIRRGFI
jgi:hypothetical protein